jgi:hypothetical protein
LWQQNPQIKSVPKMQFIQAHLNWTILPPNSKKITNNWRVLTFSCNWVFHLARLPLVTSGGLCFDILVAKPQSILLGSLVAQTFNGVTDKKSCSILIY